MKLLREAIKRGSFVLLVWALNLFVLWVISWAIFEPDVETVVLLSIASASMLVYAGWAFVREWRAGEPGDVEEVGTVHDSSHSTALAGAAIIGLFLSAEFGPWLTFIAGGALVLALAGIVREQRAARSALKQLDGLRATDEGRPLEEAHAR